MMYPEPRTEVECPNAECLAYIERINNQISVLYDILSPVIFDSPNKPTSTEKCSSKLVIAMDNINDRLSSLIESIRL